MARTVVAVSLIWIVTHLSCWIGANGACGFRGTCVSEAVCNCEPGEAGCVLGSQQCPFPHGGAPCALGEDVPPQKAKDIAASIESVCPGVFTADDDVCCAEDQLSALKTQLTSARGLLKSCPACWANFARFWCTFTCSPTQASFVEITKKTVCNSTLWPACDGSASSDRSVAAVQDLNVRVSKEYADGLYRSCKDVTLTATGDKVMQTVFGGAGTAQAFLHFQGASAYDAGQNPININFQLISSTESAPIVDDVSDHQAKTLANLNALPLVGNGSSAMEGEIVKCETTDPAHACMCTDCAAACPAAPPDLLDTPWWKLPLGSKGAGEEPSLNLFVAAVALCLMLLYLVAALALISEAPLPPASTRPTQPKDSAEAPELEEEEGRDGETRQGGDANGETADTEIEEAAMAGGRTREADRSAASLEEGRQGRGAGVPTERAGSQGGVDRRRAGASKPRSATALVESLYLCGRWLGQRPGTMSAVWLVAGVVSVLVLWLHPLEVVTDPVRLWAKEGSRALVEKEFFDSRFGTFWRSEMIIAKRAPLPEHAAGRRTDSRPNTLPFLLRILELQQQLESITVSCEEVRAVDSSVRCGLFDRSGNGSQHYGLQDLCFQPVPGAGCLVESVLEYWQVNRTRLEGMPGCGDPVNHTECEQKVRQRIDDCAKNGASKKLCWSRAGVPLPSKVLFGSRSNPTPSDSEAFIVTYLLNSDPWTHPRAVAWERKLIKLLQAKTANIDLSFSTEASLEAELARGGAADYLTIAVSYLVMLIYVTCSLGSGGQERPWGLRLLLSLTGVCSVGLSLLVAAALCSLAGVKATLIISEVIPFIVLAIGVDNIFILVWGFDASRGTSCEPEPRMRRVSFEDDSAVEHPPVCDSCRVVPAVRAGLALERVGPSVISAATAQAAAFTIGSWTGMPAVLSFAVLAAVAVAVDAVIQLTLFLPILAATDGMFSQDDGESLQSNLLSAGQGAEREAGEQREKTEAAATTWLDCRVRRGAVLAVCGVGLFAALCCSTQVRLGLEQAEALPKGSYLIDYFQDLAAYVKVGAPFFLVVRGQAPDSVPSLSAPGSVSPMDFSNPERIKTLCSRPGCNRTSVGNLVGNLALYSNYTFVATGMSNFLDDYITWLDPSEPDVDDLCCRVPIGKNGSRGGVCPAHWTPALHPGTSPPAGCACNSTLTYTSPACPTAPAVPCTVAGGCLAPNLPDSWFQRFNKTSGAGRCFGVRLAGLCPKGGEMPYCAAECYRKSGHFVDSCLPRQQAFPNSTYLTRYFPDFLRSESPSDPTKSGGCSVGGEHYGSEIANLSLAVLGLHGRPEPASVRGDIHQIEAARFMAYHSSLVTQEEYIGALRYMYKFVDGLRAALQLDIGVHSVFYVFFEQYLTMESSSLQVTGLGLLVVWLVVWAMLGSLRASLLLLSTALSILVVLVGVMGAWDVRLNALSAVNLVASIGIAVEFSVHLVHAFLRSRGSPSRRAAQAFFGVGSAVFSGIAVTKLLGVSVLALAHSRIFVVYYFRMYFSLVLAGSLYGLLLLPVLLIAFLRPEGEPSESEPRDSHREPDANA